MSDVSNYEDEMRGTRERLAAELQRLRSLAGLSGRELARRIGISQSKVSRIESGVSLPSLPEVMKWATAVTATPEATQRLIAATEAAFTEVQAWRTALRDRPHLQGELLELERLARRTLTFQPSVVPGLLQTAEYARRVFTLFQEVPYGEQELAAAVAARLGRQTALYREDKRFEFLITEAALRWRPGSPRLLVTQFDRLASLGTLENVRIGIIPSDTEALTYSSHGFVIFDGDDDHDAIVTVEAVHAKLTVSGPDDIELYRRRWSLLSRMALFGDEARDFLVRLRAAIGVELQGEEQ